VKRFMKKFGPLVCIILAASFTAGCMVGPKYHKPVVQTPAAYRGLRESPQAQASSFADLPWWQVFQDPQLQELIRTALKQNYDMQLATERINAERAQLSITRSQLFPQAQASGNFTGGKEQNFQSKSNFLALTADAAFQLDFFGNATQLGFDRLLQFDLEQKVRAALEVQAQLDLVGEIIFYVLDRSRKCRRANEHVNTNEDDCNDKQRFPLQIGIHG